MSTALDPDPRRARIRVGVGAVVVLALAALGVAVVAAALAPAGSTAVVAATSSPGGDPVASRGVVYVHVLGEVAAPGLFELVEGARAVDAIAAAGGFTDAADPASVNLARELVDGEQLVVLALGAAPPPSRGGGAGPVNLNTADAAALDSLPRIGPALAERIIRWREANGPFASVDHLGEVSGIGSATIEGLRDLVTV